MKSFEELYYEVLIRTLKEKDMSFLDKLQLYDSHQLDCLLHPKKHAPVWPVGKCSCGEEERGCIKVCSFHAINAGTSGTVTIDPGQCTGCAACIKECQSGKLTGGREAIAAIQAIHSHKGLIYALVAPAFLGQFSSTVTPGMLRNALKKIGFDGMIEVSLFADILTLKEALEFDKNIKTEEDYQLTSCCCPIWIAMIRKTYHSLMPHIPPAVSPMIASGRAVKAIHSDALTIFIGPCLAKKAEAKEKDLAGAVDYVLTFQEINDIFRIMNIDPSKMQESEMDHSSQAGRCYAYTGGVSHAVSATLDRLNPHRRIRMNTKQADGIPACREMMKELTAGKKTANFYEGMGCVGGCVGGPKAIIPPAAGKKNVEEYGASAPYPTPIDNPYVIELLHQLGLDTVDSLLKTSEIFTRSFE